MNFRTKIFLSQLLLFVIFFSVLLPFIQNTVAEIVQRTFLNETRNIIKVLETAQNQEEIFKLVEQRKQFVLVNACIFNSNGDEIYDSNMPGKSPYPAGPDVREEVQKALLTGQAYIERASIELGQKVVFIAVAFTANGERYVFRSSYPYYQVDQMIQDFQTSFIILASLILLFFMLMMWFVFARLSQPIQQIISEIKPFQEGKTEELPVISLSEKLQKDDEIRKLANTLNALSSRAKLQMQQIKDERNEKVAILESLGEGVVAVDADLKIQYVNFMAGKMLGLPRKQLIGQPITSVADANRKPLIERCRELILRCQQERAIVTDTFSIGDVRKVYLDLIAAPKADERGAIIVLQDNSDHYRILQMGKDFVANASHELRTPITVIRGFAETLQDLPEISEEMLHDITDKILRNCQRMDHLVKSLLTLADIENMPLANLQECDLFQLVEDTREHILAGHPSAPIKIEGEQAVHALAARDLLELALANLLENAIKYSPPGSPIIVSVRKQENMAKISVSDRGIGIPEGDLDQIFNRFYTVDKAHSRKLGGAGLGLSIVKTIIEKHDGTVTVASQIGKGTTFTIFLPLFHR